VNVSVSVSVKATDTATATATATDGSRRECTKTLEIRSPSRSAFS
jgi:hypothetical protein